MKNLWTYYSVSFRFLTKLCASVPANPELTKIWLENRQPRVRPAGGRSISEINEEVVSTLLGEEEATPSLLVFQRIDGVLVMRAATVRAHIKDCARVISAQYVGKIKGERSFATKVINGVYHDETQYWLPILSASREQFTDPTGIYEKPIRFRLPDGRQMSAIKILEYVENASLHFRLKVLGSIPGIDDLRSIFEYGATHGYGGERGDGEGRYEFTIEKEKEDGKQQNYAANLIENSR